MNVTEKLKFAPRIIISACGTAWHAGLVGEYMIEQMCKIPVEVEYASEFRYRNPVIYPNDIMFVISQSGETADTLAALKEAKSRGAEVYGIVNVVGSTIARENTCRCIYACRTRNWCSFNKSVYITAYRTSAYFPNDSAVQEFNDTHRNQEIYRRAA
jgi:glucosamine 6-phosphate synthetase-like amidotransferase/phosphosugar isomerase protein